MTAVSTVDTFGGLVLAVGAAVWLIATGIRDRARQAASPCCCQADASLPDDARQCGRVEAGTFVAAGTTYREGVAGRSSRPLPAATPIDVPGPYSRAGVRK